MLVLTRRVGEQIVIGRDIRLMVTRVRGRKVSLGIDAPPSISIDRGERLTKSPAADAPEEDIAFAAAR